jgi:hypothetical protein
MQKEELLIPAHLFFITGILNYLRMFLIFRNKIRSILNNKPQITFPLSNCQPEQGAVPEYIQYWMGYASAGMREICTCILQSGHNKSKNQADDINLDDS